MAAFIGQCGHESGGFKLKDENLSYSAERLMVVWPKRFPTIEVARKYSGKPEKLANRVYANRLGNGDEASGDGWRYRGRGLIQLTGKANYAAAGKYLGDDLVTYPGLVGEALYAALTAGWFWEVQKLNALADQLDHAAITRKINGGLHGLADRIARTEMALKILADPEGSR